MCSLKVGDLKTYRNPAVIDVIGKGGKFRCIPLNAEALIATKDYLRASGNGTGPSNAFEEGSFDHFNGDANVLLSNPQ